MSRVITRVDPEADPAFPDIWLPEFHIECPCGSWDYANAWHSHNPDGSVGSGYAGRTMKFSNKAMEAESRRY